LGQQQFLEADAGNASQETLQRFALQYALGIHLDDLPCAGGCIRVASELFPLRLQSAGWHDVVASQRAEPLGIGAGGQLAERGKQTAILPDQQVEAVPFRQLAQDRGTFVVTPVVDDVKLDFHAFLSQDRFDGRADPVCVIVRGDQDRDARTITIHQSPTTRRPITLLEASETTQK